MKAYTLGNLCLIEPGIELLDGAIKMGLRPVDHKPWKVKIDDGATILNDRFLEAPGSGALLFIQDQATPFGYWHMRDVMPDPYWDAMVKARSMPNRLDAILAEERARMSYPIKQPNGWHEFSRGVVEPLTENARPLLNLYGYLEDGTSFEIKRCGKLNGAPEVHRVVCTNGEVFVSDPRAEASARVSKETR